MCLSGAPARRRVARADPDRDKRSEGRLTWRHQPRTRRGAACRSEPTSRPSSATGSGANPLAIAPIRPSVGNASPAKGPIRPVATASASASSQPYPAKRQAIIRKTSPARKHCPEHRPAASHCAGPRRPFTPPANGRMTLMLAVQGVRHSDPAISWRPHPGRGPVASCPNRVAGRGRGRGGRYHPQSRRLFP